MGTLICTRCEQPRHASFGVTAEPCECGGFATTRFAQSRSELRQVSEKRMEREGEAVPYGYCHCGCGNKTALAPQTSKSRGWVKGEPIRFLPYHAARLAGRARAEQIRTENGIPANAPVDSQGRRCEAKTCVVCGGEFLAQWSHRLIRKTCSPKCAAELRRANPAMKARRGKANPNYKGGSRTGVRDREGERRWYIGAEDRCQHPCCPGTVRGLDLHHVVYAQHVRKAAGDCWDPRNSLTLCRHCHSSHHRRGSQVVPITVLRDETLAFAWELLGTAAESYLKRYYGGDDSRLDRLADFGLTEAGRLAA